MQKAGLKYNSTSPSFTPRPPMPRSTSSPHHRRPGQSPDVHPLRGRGQGGAFWMIRRVLRDGMTADAALAEARKVGLVDAPHLENSRRSTSPRTHRSPSSARNSRPTVNDDLRRYNLETYKLTLELLKTGKR